LTLTTSTTTNHIGFALFFIEQLQPIFEKQPHKQPTMAENDNNSINSNDNDNNDDTQRGFLSSVLHRVTTPIRVIREIQNLEEHLGLERTTLFQDYNNDTALPEQQEEEEDEEVQVEDPPTTPIHTTMPTNSYSFGDFNLNFDDETPEQNTDLTVGVVISKADRPEPGSDDERKLIESLCKNQYTKYRLPEANMKSIERLLQSRGIMDTISGTKTALNKFDMKETFTVVYPADKSLKRVALIMNFDNSNIKSVDLLSDFRKVTVEEVALSCSWWNLHGHYFDNEKKKHSLGRDMNWSYLHFKNHTEEVLYNDVDKSFQEYEQHQRGGALFFKLLADAVLSSNEDSLAALETTIKQYNVAKDGNDDVLEATKVLRAGSKSILAMRADGSGKSALPDSFVSDIIQVYTTSSVDFFNEKMQSYQVQLELNCLMEDSKTINTPLILERTFKLADAVYNKLAGTGAWQAAANQKAKSTFIFWKNRCWNCKKENCNAGICKLPIDAERMEENRLEWAKENNKDPNSRRGSTSKGGERKGRHPEWDPPSPDENNKRIIYNKPYTWNGRNSWILDDTPDSGLKAPGMNNLADDSSIPSQIPKIAKQPDDATAITQDTSMSPEKQNEIRRLQANLANMTASLASILKQE
jgi:hypothetical protein